MMMAMHGSKRRDMKWVILGRSRILLICFLLLISAYVTSSHQYTDQKATPASNETKGVDIHAKVFYKHTWPVSVFNIHKYFYINGHIV